jgi:hypothetical protein
MKILFQDGQESLTPLKAEWIGADGFRGGLISDKQ